MQIIGLLGLAGAGKTTLAEMLAKRIATDDYGIPAVRQFAGPLKRAATALGADKAERPVLYRKLCQQVGDWCRDETACPDYTGPDFFVDRMKDEIAALFLHERNNESEYIVIIDDVRFENEVAALREMGATLVYCDASERGVTPDSSEIYQHISEALAVYLLEDDEMSVDDEAYYCDFRLSLRDMEETRRQIQGPIGALLIGEIIGFDREDYSEPTESQE